MCMAPPTLVGAWSMAVLQGQPFEYYYYYDRLLRIVLQELNFSLNGKRTGNYHFIKGNMQNYEKH